MCLGSFATTWSQNMHAYFFVPVEVSTRTGADDCRPDADDCRPDAEDCRPDADDCRPDVDGTDGVKEVV